MSSFRGIIYSKFFLLSCENKIEYFLCYLLILIPLTLVSGPFLPDLFLTLLAFYGLYCSFKFNKEIFVSFKKFIFLFIIFFLILLLSSILSENPTKYLLGTFTHIRFFFFVVGSYFLLSKYRDELIQLIYFWLLCCFFVVCCDAIFQYFFSINFLLMPIEGRLSGLFGEQLILGSYLSRLLPILCALYFFLKPRKNFYFFIFVFILTNLVVLLSKERAAFLYLIFSDLLFIFLLFKKNSHKIIIFSIITFLFSIFFIFEKNSFYRLYNVTLEQFESKLYTPNIIFKYLPYSDDHEEIYHAAIKMIGDDIFTGHGPWSFRDICKNYLSTSHLKCSTHPHNTYLQLFAETGFFGFLFLSVLFFFILFRFFKILLFRNSLNSERFTSLFLLLAVIISLWPLIPTGNFFNNWLSIIYFYPIPLLFYLSNKIMTNQDLL